MANSKVLFSGLKFGKCSSVVEARLMRFWEARNVKCGGELMWVDLLMVNSTIIHATIRANRLPTFRRRLTAGAMYSISDYGKPEIKKSSYLYDMDSDDEQCLVRIHERSYAENSVSYEITEDMFEKASRPVMIMEMHVNISGPTKVDVGGNDS
ncbi:hypothetical protein F2Q70_00036542 [Brassica cretica]|nr:hypothetical protein F2Q70_00036542 [Brassica cretica]